ncbi:MAG: hypothetical protein IKQ29_01900 [Bacilli bacterium]|nr:hypothetical protein [Bacilli bacterium]
MAIDGQLKMLPEDARQRANNIRRDAKNMNDLFTTINKYLSQINDESLGTYHGERKPSELRAELDAFASTFATFYEQVLKFASDVETAANVAEQE